MAEAARLPLAQWLLALGVALALSGAFLAWRHWPAPAPPALPPAASLASATRVDDPVPLPAFALRTSEGTLGNAELLGHWTLIDFGYTFCPDVCPLDTARNVTAVEILQEQGLEVRPVFISIDPERDTPEALAAFVGNLHPQMVGLTGTPEQVRAASQAYRTFYQKQDTDDEFYLMDHSTFSYLVLPGHGFVEFFRRETTPEAMAEAMACFVQASAAAN